MNVFEPTRKHYSILHASLHDMAGVPLGRACQEITHFRTTFSIRINLWKVDRIDDHQSD